MKNSSSLKKAAAFAVIALGFTLTACDRSVQQPGVSGQTDMSRPAEEQQPGTMASPEVNGQMSGTTDHHMDQSSGSMGSDSDSTQ